MPGSAFAPTNLDDDVEDLVPSERDPCWGTARSIRRTTVDARDVEIETPGGTDCGSVCSGCAAADDEHYRMLVDEADNLVIFLGAGVNADDHEGPFREGRRCSRMTRISQSTLRPRPG